MYTSPFTFVFYAEGHSRSGIEGAINDLVWTGEQYVRLAGVDLFGVFCERTCVDRYLKAPPMSEEQCEGRAETEF